MLCSMGLPCRWIAVAGAVLLVAVAANSLVPVAFQVRTGLHWLIEHFLAYFAVTFLLCLAWPRPFIVAAALMVLAAALEALQGLTADRIPDLPTAFCGAAGVLAGALLASVVTEMRRAGASAATPGRLACEARPPALARPREICCILGPWQLPGGAPFRSGSATSSSAATRPSSSSR